MPHPDFPATTPGPGRTRRPTALPVATGIALALLLGGCGGGKLDNYLPDERLAYKKAREAEENLELPPDLAGGSFDDAMDIPPAAGSATYSD
jgi:outer membrane protein assembly factor BamC